VATPTEPSAEFNDFEQRLASVKKTLTAADKAMSESTRLWTQQLLDQRAFSKHMVEGYPSSEGETHDLAKSFSDGAQMRYDRFVRETSTEQVEFHRLHQEVRAYLDEIKEVEAMYPALKTAKSEKDRYESKVGHLATGRMPEKDKQILKKERNLAKLDANADKYQALSDRVISAQRTSYSKASTVFKMVLCSYWRNNAHHLAVAGKSLEHTSKWSAKVSEELKNVTVASIVTNESVHPEVPTDVPTVPRASTVDEVSEVKKVIPAPIRKEPVAA
jgi:hypothetical protein